ncbi:unnamed product, partial [Ostreococcus tauri]
MPARVHDPARGTVTEDEDARDVDDAMGRLIQTMIARSRDDDGSIDGVVDPADVARARAMTSMVAVTLPRVLETIARVTVGAMETRAGETREALARALETSRRRCEALETRLRDAEDALDGVRERLGREMLRRGGDEDEHGEGATRESLRNELELYREACRRYRKRAEHF